MRGSYAPVRTSSRQEREGVKFLSYERLTPSEVLPERWCQKWIRDTGECWEWTGPLFRNPGGEEVPKAGNRAVRSVVMENVEGRSFGRQHIIPICESPSCVHPGHLDSPFSDAGRLLFIKQNSVQRGECRIWTGRVANNCPVVQTRRGARNQRTSLSVHRFVYTQEYGVPDFRDGHLELTCGNRMCVSHKHITYTFRPASGLCPEGHKLPARAASHCPTCLAHHEQRTCSEGHVMWTYEGTEPAKLCLTCRDNEARAFIDARNAEAFKRGTL